MNLMADTVDTHERRRAMTQTGELIRFDAAVTTTAPPQAVLEVLRDLSAHLEWAGRRSTQKTFRLLDLEAPAGPATVGTRFSSSGANNNGTFHDSSVVTEASPYRFSFETDSRLDRRHGQEWHVHFTHRYDVQPQATGARIVFTGNAHDGSYVPYWLKPGMRTLTRTVVNRMIAKQMRNLARLAEERAANAPAAADTAG